MSKKEDTIVTFRVNARHYRKKPVKRNKEKGRGPHESCPAKAPRLNVLEADSVNQGQNRNTEIKCKNLKERKFVNDFLGNFFGRDIIFEFQYCSRCAWTGSGIGEIPEQCPLCGLQEGIRKIVLIVDRRTLLYEETVFEIKPGG